VISFISTRTLISSFCERTLSVKRFSVNVFNVTSWTKKYHLVDNEGFAWEQKLTQAFQACYWSFFTPTTFAIVPNIHKAVNFQTVTKKQACYELRWRQDRIQRDSHNNLHCPSTCLGQKVILPHMWFVDLPVKSIATQP